MQGRHHSYPIDPCLTFRSFPFPWRCSAQPNRISHLDAIRNSFVVPPAAGKSWIRLLSVIPVCNCLRDVGPCGIDQVIVLPVFIVCFAFRLPFVSYYPRPIDVPGPHFNPCLFRKVGIGFVFLAVPITVPVTILSITSQIADRFASKASKRFRLVYLEFGPIWNSVYRVAYARSHGIP